jgi:hypothetical protein
MAIVGKDYSSVSSTSSFTATNMVEYDTDKILLISGSATSIICSVAIPDSTYSGFASVGSPYAVSTGATAQYIQAVAVSTTNVVISYKLSGTDYGYVVVASIAGDVVTFGTPLNVLAAYYSPLGIAKLDTDKCIVHYGNSTTNVNTTIITNVGTVASMSATPLTYSATSNSALLGQHLIQAISSTQALVLYNGATKPCARVIDISGTIMTANAEVESASAISSGRNLSLNKISSTKFIMGAKLSATSLVNYAHVTVTGTTPTFGSYVATTTGSGVIKVEIINSSYAISHDASGDYFYLLNISGSTPSIINSVSATNWNDITMISLSDTRCMALSSTGVLSIVLIDSFSTLENVLACSLLVEVGVGKQVEISSIYATFTATNISVNDIKAASRLTITSSATSPLILANAPIVLSAGDKLYVSSTGNVNMYGLERTV